eukprot:1136375-Pelagomonas_calceolata.AAC.2
MTAARETGPCGGGGATITVGHGRGCAGMLLGDTSTSDDACALLTPALLSSSRFCCCAAAHPPPPRTSNTPFLCCSASEAAQGLTCLRRSACSVGPRFPAFLPSFAPPVALLPSCFSPLLPASPVPPDFGCRSFPPSLFPPPSDPFILASPPSSPSQPPPLSSTAIWLALLALLGGVLRGLLATAGAGEGDGGCRRSGARRGDDTTWRA